MASTSYKEFENIMGWGNCGTDSNGRPLGYVFPAFCDHSGCNKKIDRGLSYACGGMHGEEEYSCEGYFCEDHRTCVETPAGDCISICHGCIDIINNEPDIRINDNLVIEHGDFDDSGSDT